MHTLESLAAAKAQLTHWDKKCANDSSNNPNKHVSQRNSAATQVSLITMELKRLGILEKTEAEILDEELDRVYPNALSKSIVTYNGHQYQATYFKVDDKTPWDHTWKDLGAAK